WWQCHLQVGSIAVHRLAGRQPYAVVHAPHSAGHTPLHLACRYGHVSVALALLIKGCDIDACDSEGNTPLHKAASNNHAALCKELVRRGADLARANNSRFTALHWAAY
ncbi:ankyrin repeat-containing domain protein, partial [Tribonema minus]